MGFLNIGAFKEPIGTYSGGKKIVSGVWGQGTKYEGENLCLGVRRWFSFY